MDDLMQSTHQPGAPSTPTSWEHWVDTTYRWIPYATLAGSIVLAQVGSTDPSDRVWAAVLTLIAAAWTWLTFTRSGPPTRVPQRTLRIYFAGFIVMAGLLVLREPMFLIYGITGFFHASLLRPWPLMFTGIGATAFVVHSHIVIPDGTATNWAIYIGVVVIQTVPVAAGLYFGERITEIADQRRQALEDLELAMRENVGLHEQLVVQAREAGVLDERQRLAREIHDTIAQGLTGVITQIEATHQSWGDEGEMRRHLDNASGLARGSLDEARRSVQAIRPAPLDDSRLPEAMTNQASRWSEITGIPVQVHSTGERRLLPADIEVILLRAVQEGLANVEKHAAATRVGVTLTYMDDSITLDIRDDGIGFQTSERTKVESFGLAAMRQRVTGVHGVMQIESAPGEGTAISVHIPTDLVGSSHV